jgi:hypothetical protein
LHADQGHQALAASAAKRLDDPAGLNPTVGFVDGGDAEFDAITENTTRLAVQRDAVQGRKRVRRYVVARPLDHVTVVVVVGRLDQEQQKGLAAFGASSPDGHGHLRSNLVIWYRETATASRRNRLLLAKVQDCR